MPIYEYRCESCDHELEAIQKISDPVLSECPACGKATLKKLISAAGFQLKGNGWYATDFKDKKADKKPKSGTKTEAKTASAPSGPAAASKKTGSSNH